MPELQSIKPIEISDEQMQSIIDANPGPIKEMFFPLEKVMYKPIDETKSGCPGVYSMKTTRKDVGTGNNYGSLYEACCAEKCDYVAKFIECKDIYSCDKVLYEADDQQFASTNGIAPAIQEVWYSSGKGILIIMNALRDTLADVLFVLSKEQKECVDEYRKMLLSKDDFKDPRTFQINPIVCEMCMSSVDTLFCNECGERNPSVPYGDYEEEDFMNKVQLNYEYKQLTTMNIFEGGNAKSMYKKLEGIQSVAKRMNYEGKPVDELIITPEDTQEDKEYNMNLLRQAHALLIQLHKIGLTHNDAHPYNFMFDMNDKLYLIDFGMAKNIESKEDIKDDISTFIDYLKSWIEKFTNLRYLFIGK